MQPCKLSCILYEKVWVHHLVIQTAYLMGYYLDKDDYSVPKMGIYDSPNIRVRTAK